MYFYQPRSRHIIVTGHFGSGKTNVAVNLALELKKAQADVAVADMDIVNPYFRAADAVVQLRSVGIKCIIPEYANTNADMPALPAEIYSAFSDNQRYTIFDVGGDDTGAAALGMFASHFNRSGYEMLYVCNMYRPLTDTPEAATELMRDIEERSRLKCTGIVNNSNIGSETTQELFTDSFDYAAKLSRLTGLALCFDAAFYDFDISDRNIFIMKNVTKSIYGGN